MIVYGHISCICLRGNEGRESKTKDSVYNTVGHFTVVCLVAWPLNESETGVDLVLILTSLLFLC